MRHSVSFFVHNIPMVLVVMLAFLCLPLEIWLGYCVFIFFRMPSRQGLVKCGLTFLLAFFLQIVWMLFLNPPVKESVDTLFLSKAINVCNIQMKAQISPVNWTVMKREGPFAERRYHVSPYQVSLVANDRGLSNSYIRILDPVQFQIKFPGRKTLVNHTISRSGKQQFINVNNHKMDLEDFDFEEKEYYFSRAFSETLRLSKKDREVIPESISMVLSLEVHRNSSDCRKEVRFNLDGIRTVEEYR